MFYCLVVSCSLFIILYQSDVVQCVCPLLMQKLISMRHELKVQQYHSSWCCIKYTSYLLKKSSGFGISILGRHLLVNNRFERRVEFLVDSRISLQISWQIRTSLALDPSDACACADLTCIYCITCCWMAVWCASVWKAYSPPWGRNSALRRTVPRPN